MSNKDEPAFPVGNGRIGLTKREWFAGMALQGLCVPCIPGHHNANDIPERKLKAHQAVHLADELIEAFNNIKE